MNIKIKSLNSAFIRTLCGVKSYKISEVQSFGIDTGPLSFCNLFTALSIIRWFDISQEICCPGLSSRHCCYRNHAAGSKSVLKIFITLIDNCISSLCTKIISKCCELVKLCHINISGLAFFETQCIRLVTVNSDLTKPVRITVAH